MNSGQLFHRPPAQHGGIMLVLLVLVLAAGVGGTATYLIISRVDVTLLLRDQPATAIIPQKISGTATVADAIGLQLTETIRTQVPINQKVTIPVKDTLDILVHFDGQIPLRMKVRLKDQIPLKQIVDLNTTVSAFLPALGSTIDIPLRGKIPIDTLVPVDLVIPVDQMVRLRFSTPVQAHVDQDLTVPLRTVIDAEVPIDAALSVPVLNALEAVVELPTTPSQVLIKSADLTLPLRSLKLDLLDGGDAPAEAAP